MNAAFIKNIKVLKKAIDDRKLVVFAGSGVSMDSGLPLWQTLIDSLRSDINIPSNETDFLRIAQMYYNERQNKEFVDKIREVLKHKKVRYNDIHEAIFDLKPEHIITTNFDDLFEQVIKTKAYPFSVIKKDSEFPYAQNTKLLVKMHGDLDEGNFVIKEDDYLEYEKNHPLIESFIKGVFANKVILFLGYSFSDYSLKIILQGVRNILGKNFQHAYMLNTEREFHPSKREYLKRKGINVINYDDCGLTHGKNAIQLFLFSGRNAFRYEYELPNKTLSEHGKKLLYLIKFIRRYDAFAESIVNEDSLTKMHKSLQRFQEVAVLPATFLGNLFPFNAWKGYIHNYYEYTLGSNNNEITKFFFKHFNQDTFSLNDSFFDEFSISKNRKEEFEKMLEEVLMHMNYASIYRFGKSGKVINIFEHPQDLKEKVNILKTRNTCDCLGCLYNGLKFKSFFKELKNGSITETSELQNDLLLAYSNYKAGNFKTSYSQFEEIANKAWQLGKYITYYITKKNIKYLRNMLEWQEENFKEENKRLIIEKIDDMDLDKLLFQIPALDESEYKLLKIIKDDEILLKSEKTIEEFSEKVISVYNSSKMEGKAITPYYPKIIEGELQKIFLFYTRNYIIKDVYTDFTNVVQKGITALLISYATHDKYESKLRDFGYFTIKMMILYMDDGKLRKLINDYKIKKIYIDKNVSDSLRLPNNLFESGFNTTNFLGKTVHPDTNISSQSNYFFFKQTYRNIVHNTLTVFSLIEIPADYSNVLIRSFLDFLKVQSVFANYSDKYVNSFLFNLKEHLSFENYLQLLRISFETEANYVDDHFFEIIGHGIKTYHPNRTINEENLMKSIINKFTDHSERSRNLGFMFLWKVSNEINKKLIEQALREELAFQYEAYTYLRVGYEGIFSPQELVKEYIRDLEKHGGGDVKWEEDKPIVENFIFSNYLNFVYTKEFFPSIHDYSRWNDYPEHWKFFLDPVNYDYTKFETRWLKIIDWPAVHNKLASIPIVKEKIDAELKTSRDEKLGELYIKYYLGK